MSILTVHQISKTYRASSFKLEDITFEIPSGTIMGLIGENGAGKTTIINLILNTINKESGTVTVFGEELLDSKREMRENIGVVFDASNFAPGMTPSKIGKVLSEIYAQWDKGIYESYLDKFGLPGSLKVKEMSRGMTMKLAIACALSHQPKLLILDEATSGLDPVVRNEILDVFLDFVQDESHGILLSSHITTDLEKIADYITLIHQGKLVLVETKDALLYHYGILRCTSNEFHQIAPDDVIVYLKEDYQTSVLVKDRAAAEEKYEGMVMDNTTLEEIMLMIAKGEQL